jgi:hypothetical protein
MADESKNDPSEDIESILLGLDAILTDGEGASPAPTPAPAPAAKIEIPSASPPSTDPPKENQVELSPRDGMIKPPEKKTEPPKPAPKLPDPRPSIELSASTPAPAPKAAPPSPASPVPAPAAAAGTPEAIPPDAPKEQIRRVAYIYAVEHSEVKTVFAAFLSQAARTISKKPLFLREVSTFEVGVASDVNSILQKAQQSKAVAILAIVEGWAPVKIDELTEACSRANMLFRAVAPGDAQKKSTSVDIIVDMMLLPGEN